MLPHLHQAPEAGVKLYGESISRAPFHTPGHLEKSNLDLGMDDALAEGRLPKFQACEIVGYRKRIARRHAKRKVERASRRRNR